MTEAPAIERVHPPDALMKLANPVMKFLAPRARPVQEFVIILHYRGRKSGRSYDQPVGYRLIEGTITLLTSSKWRHNFRGGMEIEVTYRGKRRGARATLIEDPDAVASYYESQFLRYGRKDFMRRMGMRINVERQPSHSEWLEAIEREKMSMVRIDLDS